MKPMMKMMIMNNIEGIGIDIIEIDRLKKAIDRFKEPFIKRIFTKDEIIYCKKHKNDIFRFAGRYAAKEAIAKALGTGIGKKLSWQDIEILNDLSGKPFVKLSKKAEATFKNPKILISISHSRKSAVAFSILF